MKRNGPKWTEWIETGQKLDRNWIETGQKLDIHFDIQYFFTHTKTTKNIDNVNTAMITACFLTE